ncbi:MAG: hypothetical protein IJL89_06590, partial [Firmicutes bacterium]|nr:hypothetical protein [Bacillota bacterium]
KTGKIEINGGNITAKGGSYSAGIGGGAIGNLESIVITGGNIKADSPGVEAASIGSGENYSSAALDAPNIYISGGYIVTNNNIGCGTSTTYSNVLGYVSISDSAAISCGGSIKSSSYISYSKRKFNFTVYDPSFENTLNNVTIFLPLGKTINNAALTVDKKGLGSFSTEILYLDSQLNATGTAAVTV